MIRIDIRPVWRFRREGEREFDFQLVALLERVEETSRLAAGAQGAGLSYRHAWNLVAEWERFFGAPLVVKSRGRGTRLAPLGQRLLWAARRAQARLAPELENLAADFERSINESLRDAPSTALVMHASHDFAVGVLREMHGGAGRARGAVQGQLRRARGAAPRRVRRRRLPRARGTPGRAHGAPLRASACRCPRTA